MWLEVLLDHLKEEGKLEIQDPRRVLKVMTVFYNEDPEVQIFGEDSIFKPQSCLARSARNVNHPGKTGAGAIQRPSGRSKASDGKTVVAQWRT